jgi:PIN domain nuclease of toxin-antitoxin system
MTIKQTLGRLTVPEPPSAAVARLGIERMAVAFEHAEATLALPPLHRDPFDRLLVAQARIEGLTLVTHDPQVRSYPGVAFLPA